MRHAIWLAGGLTVSAAALAVGGALRTAGGEVLVALTLGAWSVPTAVAAGCSWRTAAGNWLLWGAVFGGGTLAVRALIARQTRRPDAGPAVAALAVVGLALGALVTLVRDALVPVVVLLGFVPAVALVATVALAPIPARRLRWVGWSLVGVSALLFAALVGSSSCADRVAVFPRQLTGGAGTAKNPRPDSRVSPREFVGGRQEARTPDLRVANAALSQLS